MHREQNNEYALAKLRARFQHQVGGVRRKAGKNENARKKQHKPTTKTDN